MAKVKAVLTKDEFEKLTDQTIKDLYVDKNGTYVLDSDHEDVSGLKTTVQTLRQERKLADDELAKWKQLGDPDKAQQALAKIQQLEEEEAKKAGEWEKLRTQIVERHAQETNTLKTQLAERDSEIEKLVVDRQIMEHISNPNLKVLSTVALFPLVKQRVSAKKEGGEYVTIVHDGKGNRMVADGQGRPMDIKGLLDDMRKDPNYAPLFGSDAKGGSGTPPNGASAGRDGGQKIISKSNTAELSRNLKEIAAGTVAVTD